MRELFRALGAMLEPPHDGLAPVARALDLGRVPTRAEHTEAVVMSLYPYASVYCGSEGMIGGDARDRVAGFFRALGVPASREPDHITLLLAMYASCTDRVRKPLFWEHLASFLPAYAIAMQAMEIEPYARWANVLLAALREEAKELGLPDRAPLHFQCTEPFVISDFMGALLAPARSGMILVRKDLVRMGRELGLGTRKGERKWVLSAMLSQDAPSVLTWLSREARTWAMRHRAHGSLELWAERAEHTAEILTVFIKGGLAAPPLPLGQEAHHAL